MLRSREARLLVAGYTGHSWVVVGMWAWIPAFLAAGFALKSADTTGATTACAYLSGVLHLVGASAALSMSRRSDRAGRRPVLVALAAAGAAVSFGIGWLIHAPPLRPHPARARLCLRHLGRFSGADHRNLGGGPARLSRRGARVVGTRRVRRRRGRAAGLWAGP